MPEPVERRCFKTIKSTLSKVNENLNTVKKMRLIIEQTKYERRKEEVELEGNIKHA